MGAGCRQWMQDAWSRIWMPIQMQVQDEGNGIQMQMEGAGCRIQDDDTDGGCGMMGARCRHRCGM